MLGFWIEGIEGRGQHMSRRHFTPEEIIGKLREADVNTFQ
jgi:hypothetical protein